MRNLKKIIALSSIALTLTASYGCEPKVKEKKQILLAESVDPNKETRNNTVKIALLLDTSNSMDGLINQAKSQLWDIVNEFTHAKCGNESRPELQIALYQYGNDDLSYREGYIQQVLNFSSDLDEISEKLFSLTTNGGEEYCGEVIQTSLKQLEWGKNPDNLKMIFIAGNEPFTQGKLNYKAAVGNAKEKDVVVNTIFCGNYEQGIETEWKKGAQLTGGEYMAIDHNREVVHINTPYDDIIIKLNSKLNKTYVGYGSRGASKMEMQVTQDDNALALEEVVAVKRAVSKSSRLYNNKSWDLVDASAEADFELEKLDEESLPKDLKGKSKKEIEKYIETKRIEREEIQNEIAELNRKRQEYISKNQKENAEGELESAMLKAIKKQAGLKNYSWD
ncbi:VWA domain-containing protein [Maribacter sp. PR1]|uniref:VWA domain-containing protein n=1 Tax=Maribacter cobaltidurans TaxID=1178778 RepID=A0ABU7IP09_9FLAO|nr:MULTISPECIES: VWA domain-containing protein [Maribacter]MDC6387309.1 VWA domain-containing protein [Maribacter sp. PR1]MEE1974694.1 VWA domain-containing protein [Maribacter cobaltidurans]